MSECGLKAGSERMNAIELTNLTRVYDRPVVDHLNLTIGEGELFGLLGVNGAGKTTTIRMLSCLTAPTEGDARTLTLTREGKTVYTQTDASCPDLRILVIDGRTGDVAASLSYEL